jgi:hypothetical protein
MRCVILAATLGCVLASSAVAQQRRFVGMPYRPNCSYGNSTNCITLNFQIETPSPDTSAGSSSDLGAAVSAANRTMFDVLNHECSVLQAAMHGACRLVQVSLTTNMHEQDSNDPQGPQGMNVTASATYAIAPADAGGQHAP